LGLFLPLRKDEDVQDFQNGQGVENEEGDKPPLLFPACRLPKGHALPGQGPNGNERNPPGILGQKELFHRFKIRIINNNFMPTT